MRIPLWDHPPLYDPAMDRDYNQGTPSLTFYPADGAGDRLCVIVFPGGGYCFRAPHEAEPVARRINAMGHHAFVLDYRVAPYRHPAPLLDAQRAVRFVRYNAERYGVRPDAIGVLGFSAGGHLAASLATLYGKRFAEPADAVDTASARPDFAVPCYAVVSMTGPFAHAGSRANLLGDPYDAERALLLSPERQVDAKTPPVFLWHTADDASVPVQNSLAFAEALARHQVPFALHVFPKGRHGLGLAEEEPEVARWAGLLEKWLERHANA